MPTVRVNTAERLAWHDRAIYRVDTVEDEAAAVCGHARPNGDTCRAEPGHLGGHVMCHPRLVREHRFRFVLLAWLDATA